MDCPSPTLYVVTVALSTYLGVRSHSITAFHAVKHMAMYYSGTLIIWTSFIQHLDYPDKLTSATYINTHAQWALPMTYWGCRHS